MKKNSIMLNGVRLILLSFLLGFINYVVTGGDKYTLTTLVIVTIILFCFGMFLFGIGMFVGLFQGKSHISQWLISIALALCGITFLTIFIRAPILKHDLNDPINLTAGIIFMLGVFIGVVAGFLQPRKDIE